MDEKSVKSWMVPSVFCLVFGLVFLYGLLWAGPALWLLIPLVFFVLCFSAALAEWWNYWVAIQDERIERRHTASIRTADGYLAEQMRGLAAQSPELAQAMAQRIGRPDLVLFTHSHGRKAQIKIAGSDVTLAFALYLLSRSTEKTMAAQRDYQEGTYHWDANGETNDRQQWQQLNWLFVQASIATRYVPGQKVNRPPEWLHPWTPERIVSNWLLGDLLEELKPYMRQDQEEQNNDGA